MRKKLTNGTKNSFEHRSVCSSGSPPSALDPRRARPLERQGERSTPPREAVQTASFERVRSAAVVASRAGGASQSKWTRRSRPWNASMPTAVVALGSILKEWLFLDESVRDAAGDTVPARDQNNAIVRNDWCGSAIAKPSCDEAGKLWQGLSRGPLRPSCPLGSRITAPPSRVRMGGGDRSPPTCHRRKTTSRRASGHGLWCATRSRRGPFRGDR